MARLGIADLLPERPASAGELAVATDSHEPSLYRLLRCLAALGVFEEHEGRSFSLTVIGDRLRSDAENRYAVGGDPDRRARRRSPFRARARDGQDGNPKFDTAFGTGIFEFLAEHPADAATHDGAMSERTAAFASSVAEGHNFSDARTVVDVGGGRGTLLVAILRRHPHLCGLLLETPTVAAAADAVLDSDIADRCEVRAGDFFEQVPRGADRYILANVLHGWDDTRVVTAGPISRRC